jgi:hypothetical protein
MDLIFVYNANTGKLNALIDSIHKAVSPDTYRCDLCQLTHGLFNERKEWLEFRQRYPGKLEFLHIDEFEQHHPPHYRYPAILVCGDDNHIQELVSAETLASFSNTQELIKHIERLTLAR